MGRWNDDVKIPKYRCKASKIKSNEEYGVSQELQNADRLQRDETPVVLRKTMKSKNSALAIYEPWFHRKIKIKKKSSSFTMIRKEIEIESRTEAGVPTISRSSYSSNVSSPTLTL